MGLRCWHIGLFVWLPTLMIGTFFAARADDAIPPSWQSTLLSSCEDAAQFGAGRTPDRPQFEFDAWEVSTTAGARVKGESLRWHVRPASERQRSARLMWAGSISRPCRAVALWVKNPNGHQINLRLGLIDADCVSYRSLPVDLGTERGWRRLVFDLTELTPASGQVDPWPGVDFPVMGLSLVVDPLEAGRPYTIYVDEIAALSPPCEVVEVISLQAPTSLGPGESIPVRVRLRCSEEVVKRSRIMVWLEDVTGGAVAGADLQSTSTEDANVYEATAPGLRVPHWLPPGRYRLHLEAPKLQVEGISTLSVAVAGPTHSSPDVRIDATTRPPRIVVDDVSYPPVIYELRGDTPASLPAEATLIAVPATTDYHPWGWAADALGADGSFDARYLDRRVAAILDTIPNALLILQVYLSTSPAWNAAHSDALQLYDGVSTAPPRVFGRSRVAPDLMAPTWQDTTAERLRTLVEYVKRAPWGGRVIGYELLAGDIGDWRPVGAAFGVGDESTPLRERAFRAWLMTHYEDVTAFRDAWLGMRRGLTGRPAPVPEGFEAARLPQPLANTPEPSLYDPAIDQPMIDLLEFRAEAQVDLLLRMARVVRQAAGDEVLVGACYGHMLAQSAERAWRWPHLALSRLLSAPEIDFFTGPFWTPKPPPIPMMPAEAVRHAGKLALERLTDERPVRALASALVSGGGLIGGPERLAELPHAVQAVSRDRPPEPQIPAIIVIDDISARYLSPEGGLAHALLAGQLELWARSGVPAQVHMLGDVLNARSPQARLYFFADQMTITPEDGRRMGTAIARDGVMLVWVYGAGSVTEQLITGRTMKYLTGIKLSLLPGRGPLQTRIEATAALPDSGLQGKPVYGLPAGAPRFFSADESVEWLGTLVGAEADADLQFCGLALKRFPQCVSVFSAAPLLPPGLIRGLAARAGIRAASDSDAGTWFGPNVLVVEGTGAPRTIILPDTATITDLRTGEVIAAGTAQVTVAPERGTFGLYLVE